MRRVVLSVALALALGCSLVGCEQSPATIPGARNNGSMNPLPDGKGFFEIRVDGAGVRGARGGRGSPEPNTIIVFFYQPDGTTEMNPAPTDVTLKIGRAQVLSLTPQTSGGSFASKPGDYPVEFRGTLGAKIGGEAIEAPVLLR
jgi:hypothetical protein